MTFFIVKTNHLYMKIMTIPQTFASHCIINMVLARNAIREIRENTKQHCL